VAVVITGNADRTRSAGYWKTQMSSSKGDFTLAEKTCLLAIAAHFSAVFNEKVNASTPALAAAVLNTANTSDPRKLLAMQLLAAWLNFANGSLDPNELVDTNGDNVPDTAFLTVVNNAEAVYNNPAATKAQLIAQKTILERINLRDE
jgi:hypothetical protein